MAPVTVNYVSVLVAGLASMVLGAVWYAPSVFGNLWMKLAGISHEHAEEAKKKGMTTAYLLQLLASLVMACVIAHIVKYAGAQTWTDGLQTGFWLWLGFIAPVTLGSVLWEGKSWKLYVLNNAHYLVALLVMGAILTAWN